MAQQKHVLVVEDSDDIRLLLSEVLEEEGYVVSVAAHGREALERLEETETLPDLILLDLMMPEMDGFEFREAQTRAPRFADIPILLMTAATEPESKSASLRAVGYLKKPFTDIEKIVAAVARYA
jgi:CheY-like chemotaxis protein